MSIVKPTIYERTYKNPVYGFLTKFGNNPKSNGGFLAKIRKFGSFMAGMVIPAIGVLIAWGLFTAILLGIKTGIAYEKGIEINEWTSEHSNKYLFNMDIVIGLGITYIIPLIISFLGGRQIYEWRGSLIGFISVLGVIGYSQISLEPSVTSIDAIQYKWTFNAIMAQLTGDVSLMGTGASPMILGALISGPLFAWIFKHVEKLYKNRIRQGFEMLVNNFSLGIAGCLFIAISFWGIGPMMALFQVAFFEIINGINNLGLLFVLPIFIEFEKIIFLNNAVNHGILGPLGYLAVDKVGYSPLFFLDPNPGQGLGLLLAYMFFGTKEQKSQSTAALPIHFIGGIHEVYYPFVLMRPINLLFMMAGGVFAGAMYQIFDFGGIFTPSPGSVIMNYLAVYSAKPLNYLALTIAIFGAAAVVFALTSASLLWKNIRTGEKTIINPVKVKAMNLFNKSKDVESLEDINLVKPVEEVKYAKKSYEKSYLWQVLEFNDGTKDYSIYEPNWNKLDKVEYKTYLKPNGKKVKYLEKYLLSSKAVSQIDEAKKQMLMSKITELTKKHDENVSVINKWKQSIESKINPNDSIGLKNLNVAYSYKMNRENYLFETKKDNLLFKIEKLGYKKGVRITVPFEEHEITNFNYETKELQFLQRTIKFKDSLEAKQQALNEVATLKQNYKNEKNSNLSKFQKTEANIRNAELKEELNKKIDNLLYVEQDNKKVKKQFFKNRVDLIDINAQQITLEDIKKKETASKDVSSDNELTKAVAKAKKIIFACEAGMGSSAMGAGMIRKMINNLGVTDIEVTNCAIKDLPKDVDIIVTQNTFAKFVEQNNKNSYVYSIKQFLKKEEYKELIDTIKQIKLK